MKTYISAVVVIFALLACLAINSSATSTYEVKPDVYVEAYKSDTVRIVESYERAVEGYQKLVEKNLDQNSQNFQLILCKLESLEHKIDDLSESLKKLELKSDSKQKPQIVSKESKQSKPLDIQEK